MRSLGPYTILDELGRGGQGVVYLAEDTRLRRKVALKVLEVAGLGASEGRLERFRREAEAASKLDHPNICAIHEAGEVDGVPYIAMRFIEGETLAHAIEHAQRQRDTGTDATPSSRDAIHAILQRIEKVARALHVAHERGLIHRDIKPGNIMLTGDGEPVILDFGLARDELAGELTLTHSGDLLGTPAYMSPEQLMAQRIPLDRRSDIYSLGATLYECLTLQRPFVGRTRAELYQRIMTQEPSRATSHNRAIPPDLQVVLETALEKDRDRRYQTALDFADDLRRVREFEPIRAKPIGNLLRLRRWAQRHPALATGGVLVNFALAVSLVLLVQVSRSRAEAVANERAAQDALAAAFLEKADRAIADGDQSAAAIFAAAALLNDPNNPHGPHYRPDANADADARRRAQQRIALMYSRHYEAEAGRLLTYERTLTPPGGRRSTGAFAFSPTEPVIAVATEEGSLVLWDLDREAAPRELEGPRPAANRLPYDKLCYSPAGDLLAQVVDGAVQLWDVRGRTMRTEIELESQPTAVEFVGEDRLAIGDAAGSVRIWSTEAGVDAELRLGSSIGSIAWSPVRGRLALVNVSGSSVTLVDPQLQQDRQLELTSAATDAVFAPDGATLLIGGENNTLWSFDVDSGRRSGLPTTEAPDAVQYSPDRRLLAHGSRFGGATVRSAGDLRQLDVAHGPFRAQRNVGFSSDGILLATSGVGTDIRLWRVGEAGRRRRPVEHERHLHWFAITADGADIVAVCDVDGSILHWSAPSGGDSGPGRIELLSGAGEVGRYPTGAVMVPRARRFAFWNKRGGVELLSLDGEAPRVIRRTDQSRNVNGAWTVACDPEGTTLYIPEVGGRVLRWDLREQRFLEPLLAGTVHVFVVAVSPDGTLIASGSQDGTVRLWRLGTGEESEILGQHEGLVSGLAFSPDGRELASAGIDADIRLWDTATRTLRHELVGHRYWVNQVAYSPDGRFLLSASDDYTVGLWEVRPEPGREPRLLQVFRSAAQAIVARFTPDGRSFYMTDGNAITRYRVTVDERIEDPRELLRSAEEAAGVRLEGLELVSDR